MFFSFFVVFCSNLFIAFICVCMHRLCVCVLVCACACAGVCTYATVCSSQRTAWESCFSFYHVGPGDGTHVDQLGSRYLCQLIHHPGPLCAVLRAIAMQLGSQSPEGRRIHSSRTSSAAQQGRNQPRLQETLSPANRVRGSCSLLSNRAPSSSQRCLYFSSNAKQATWS